MTATEEPFGNSRRSSISELLIAIGHYAAPMAWIMYLVTVTISLARWWGAVIPFWISIPFMVSTIAALAAEMYHDRKLCVLDIKAGPLLDPQAAVDKHRPALKLYHRPRQRWTMTAVALLPLLLPWTRHLNPGTPVKILFSAMSVAAIISTLRLLRALEHHRRLHPWCPWCHPRRDKDDDVVAPVPDPVGNAKN